MRVDRIWRAVIIAEEVKNKEEPLQIKHDMKISDLLAMKLGESVSVANMPFTKIGQAEITLDDGTTMFWLYDDEDNMLSVAPKEDEIVLFHQITEEIEPSEIILFQNKEYEFSYEDAGVVKQVDGDTLLEEEDRNGFSDFRVFVI